MPGPGPEPVQKPSTPAPAPKAPTPDATKRPAVDKSAGYDKQTAALDTNQQEKPTDTLRANLHGLDSARMSLNNAISAHQPAAANVAVGSLSHYLSAVARGSSELVDGPIDPRTHELLTDSRRQMQNAANALANALGQAGAWGDEALANVIGKTLSSVPKGVDVPAVNTAAPKATIKPPTPKPAAAPKSAAPATARYIVEVLGAKRDSGMRGKKNVIATITVREVGGDALLVRQNIADLTVFDEGYNHTHVEEVLLELLDGKGVSDSQLDIMTATIVRAIPEKLAPSTDAPDMRGGD